jgi:thiol:disulfide interchange protein DsbD
MNEFSRLARSAARLPAILLGLLTVFALVVMPSIARADDSFAKALQKGKVFAGGAAFVAGLFTAATPCVYPMILITVTVFGAREAKSRAQAMMLSTMFVLGIMALFTPLLVGAAFAGKLFGSLLGNKIVIVGLSSIFVALAASMFGAFELTLPEGLTQRLSTVGGAGYLGSFLLGLVTSLVAAPCVGPVLTGALVTIGQTRDLGLGVLVGVMYSLGLGIPFWLVGTFAVSLPKGGKWMLGVKSVFGIALIVLALSFLKNAFPILATPSEYGLKFTIIYAVATAIGVGIGAVHLAWEDGTGAKVRKGVGIVACVAGAFLIVAQPPKPLSWEHSEEGAVAKAKAEKRPLLVDFTAEWCGACKELSHKTFADPRVQAKMNNYVTLKIDATSDEDPQVEKVKDKYKVVGLPTVVVFDSNGSERKRFNEFVEAEAFLDAIDGID